MYAVSSVKRVCLCWKERRICGSFACLLLLAAFSRSMLELVWLWLVPLLTGVQSRILLQLVLCESVVCFWLYFFHIWLLSSRTLQFHCHCVLPYPCQSSHFFQRSACLLVVRGGPRVIVLVCWLAPVSVCGTVWLAPVSVCGTVWHGCMWPLPRRVVCMMSECVYVSTVFAVWLLVF
jgi:hypothetical protein